MHLSFTLQMKELINYIYTKKCLYEELRKVGEMKGKAEREG